MNIRETDIYEEGRTEGISQGAEQKAIETAKNLLAMKLPLDSIAKATGLSLDTVKNLADELKNRQD